MTRCNTSLTLGALCAVAVTITLLLSSTASAKCAWASTSVWPPSGESLPTDGHVLVQSYLGDIDWLNKHTGSFELVTANGQVTPMRLVEKHKGEFNLAQIWLAPTKPLPAGARVELRTTKGSEAPPSGKLRDWGWSQDSIFWTVGGTSPTAPLGKLAVKNRTWTRFGCGPASFIDLGAAGGAPELSRITVRRGGKTTTFLVPTGDDGLISVGFGMCSGPFQLEQGKRYDITVAAVNRSGKASAPQQITTTSATGRSG